MALNRLPAGNGPAWQAWLAHLPEDRPGVAAQALVHELRHLGQDHPRRRMRFLESTLATVEQLVGAVEQRLAGSALPLAQDVQLEFLAANTLLKSLAGAYTTAAGDVRRKWIGIGASRPTRLATLRAMQFEARRLSLAYRVYARGSRSAWAGLHRLYRSAREGGFAAQRFAELPFSAEQIYVHALLLDFAEPTQHAPEALERIRFYIELHADRVRLETVGAKGVADDDAEANSFLIKPGDTRSGRALLRPGLASPEAGDLRLHCAPLLARLKEQLEGLEQGLEPVTLGLPLAARQDAYQAMLRHLQRLWNAPPKRRYSRQKFKPRVDLVIGFDALWSYLAGPANRRRTDDLPVRIETSEWAIGNESPDGFSLQYLAGNAAAVRVGELVGLRPREQSVVHVCLTRRVVTGDLQSLELGVQNLAPGGTPTMVSIATANGDDRAPPRAVRVIVLPRLPLAGNAPALIAPAQSIHPGISVYLQQRRQPLRLRVGQIVERCQGCDIFALTPHA